MTRESSRDGDESANEDGAGTAAPGGEDGTAGVDDPASVRRTYDRIAEGFAATRVHPWPEVAAFLRAGPDRTRRDDRLGLDLGCGNGRHLGPLLDAVDRAVGVDLSRRLLTIAADRDGANDDRDSAEGDRDGAEDDRDDAEDDRGDADADRDGADDDEHEHADHGEEGGDGDGSREGDAAAGGDGLGRVALVQAEATRLPLRSGAVDLALYVATLHHLPTREARLASLDELARVLDGRALVSAWSTEHDRFSPPDDGGFDTTVDWTLPGGETVPRYYHVYAPEEFERDLAASDLSVERAFVSSGNCYAAVRGPERQ